jgi:carbonic anhydrase
MKGTVYMSGSEELLRQARSTSEGGLPKSPRKATAVIACIDARVEPNSILGGTQGDYHVIRNGGGLVTDDALRSLMVSQFHGTNQVVVMMHTDCAAMAYPADGERARLETETGQRIDFDLHPFEDLEVELRRGVQQLRKTPLLPYRDRIRGVIYDVDTGRVRTVVE